MVIATSVEGKRLAEDTLMKVILRWEYCLRYLLLIGDVEHRDHFWETLIDASACWLCSFSNRFRPTKSPTLMLDVLGITNVSNFIPSCSHSL